MPELPQFGPPSPNPDAVGLLESRVTELHALFWVGLAGEPHGRNAVPREAYSSSTRTGLRLPVRQELVRHPQSGRPISVP